MKFILFAICLYVSFCECFDDGAVLCAIKSSTNIGTLRSSQSPYIQGWDCSDAFLATTSICKWTGVTCSTSNTTVASLVFPKNLITGSITNTIGDFQAIEMIQLSMNSIRGSIPNSLSKLKTLKTFDISSCLIVGTIPAELGFMKSIQSINLADNLISGSIPSTLGYLSSLKSLILQGNSLSKSIPALLFLNTSGSAASLNVIDFSYNPLTGTLPSAIGNLKNLTMLSIKGGSLAGTLPSSLGNLANLQTLQLSANELSGSIPLALSTLKSLQLLTIDQNNFNSTLPAFLGVLSKLSYLSVQNNSFYGLVPLSWGNLRNLTSLSVHKNLLSGLIPSFLGGLSLLTQCNLYENKFRGVLPLEMSRMLKLTSLKLYRNALNGTIPTYIGRLTKLTTIDLRENSFIGMLPSAMSSLVKLSSLMLGRNRLTGSIPLFLTSLQRLKILYLDSNSYTGRVPSSLSLNTQLGQIYLHNNRLVGQIPAELCASSILTTFKSYGNPNITCFPSCMLSMKALSSAGFNPGVPLCYPSPAPTSKPTVNPTPAPYPVPTVTPTVSPSIIVREFVTFIAQQEMVNIDMATFIADQALQLAFRQTVANITETLVQNVAILLSGSGGSVVSSSSSSVTIQGSESPPGAARLQPQTYTHTVPMLSSLPLPLLRSNPSLRVVSTSVQYSVKLQSIGVDVSHANDTYTAAHSALRASVSSGRFLELLKSIGLTAGTSHVDTIMLGALQISGISIISNINPTMAPSPLPSSVPSISGGIPPIDSASSSNGSSLIIGVVVGCGGGGLIICTLIYYYLRFYRIDTSSSAEKNDSEVEFKPVATLTTVDQSKNQWNEKSNNRSTSKKEDTLTNQETRIEVNDRVNKGRSESHETANVVGDSTLSIDNRLGTVSTSPRRRRWKASGISTETKGSGISTETKGSGISTETKGSGRGSGSGDTEGKDSAEVAKKDLTVNSTMPPSGISGDVEGIDIHKFREVLIRFYLDQKQPEKVKSVDRSIAKYKGKIHELIKLLEIKYSTTFPYEVSEDCETLCCYC